MFNLIHESLAIRKAAALQGVRSGEVEFVNGAGAGNTEARIKAYVHNRRGSISITEGDAEEAAKYTWQEIKEIKEFNSM